PSAAPREVNSRLAARRAHRSSAGHSETAPLDAPRNLGSPRVGGKPAPPALTPPGSRIKPVRPMPLAIKDKSACRWDQVSLGEVMLRLDPGEGRIHTTRTFQVWEGGGEYNVARGLKRCFGLDTPIVTALVDHPVGRLVQDL